MLASRVSLRTFVVSLISVSLLIAGPLAPTLASVCTLADHIRSANTNAAVGFCPARTDLDIIIIVDTAMREALAECIAAEHFEIGTGLQNLVSREFTREVLSGQFRQARDGVLKVRIEVAADVVDRANLLHPDYFPAIKNSTINLVITYHRDKRFRARRRHLKNMFTIDEWTAGRKTVIRYPFNDDFFLLSYDL